MFAFPPRGGALGALILTSLAAVPGSAQAPLVQDDFDDGSLDPAWSVSFTQASGWTFTESADPGQTLLEVVSLPGVPTFFEGGACLEQTLPPTGEFDLTYSIAWDGTGALYVNRVFLLDAAGAVVASIGALDAWVDDALAGVYEIRLGNLLVQGGNGSVALAGSGSFRIVRDAAGGMTAFLDGAPLFANADSRAVHSLRVQLHRFGGFTFHPLQVDLVDLQGSPCSGGARLLTSTDSMSVSAGQVLDLFLETCPPSPGDFYFVLGSLSGTVPGIPVNGVVLPLTLDPYLMLTLQMANAPPFANTFGVLDTEGRAQAAVDLTTGLSSALIGTTLHHAFLVLDAQTAAALLASNAAALTFGP